MEKKRRFWSGSSCAREKVELCVGCIDPVTNGFFSPMGERARSISAKERATMVRPTETGERQVSAHALPGLTERSGNRAGIRAFRSSEELCNSIIR